MNVWLEKITLLDYDLSILLKKKLLKGIAACGKAEE